MRSTIMVCSLVGVLIGRDYITPTAQRRADCGTPIALQASSADGIKEQQ
jgi:hypothetical protein